MKLETIDDHTVDLSLLTPGGFVLDAGCRDFKFASDMAKRGLSVVALDCDPTIEDPKIRGVVFKHWALAETGGQRTFVMHDNPEARSILPAGHVDRWRKCVEVEAFTITEVMAQFEIAQWDCVKLDIEGAEYGLLMNFPMTDPPVSKQITVEFHEHCGPRPREIYDAIFTHLRPSYDIVQHKLENRHCAGMNWWDSLLRLRDTTPVTK